MTARRAVRAAVGALVVALVPGLLTLAAPDRELGRAPLVDVGRVASGTPAPAPEGSPAALPAAPPPSTAPPPAVAPVEALPVAVPIVPPPADLSGALAPTGAAPALFSSSPTAGEGEVLALVVGIDDYPGRGSDLTAAVDDADTIDAALAGFGVPAENRVVLRDGQARLPQLVSAVESLVARAGPGSTIVLAYAGHVRKIARDTEAIVAADGGLLTDQQLADLLAPAQSSQMWVLLATCFAGGFTEVLAPGRILTGATDASSLAYESPRLNASFLVHHLVREAWLEGKAGPSVQEAFTYADARLGAEDPRRRPEQVDMLGSPLVLGPGDPATMRPHAPTARPRPEHRPAQPQQAPPPAWSATTTTTAPAPAPSSEPGERTCTLGLLFCRRR